MNKIITLFIAILTISCNQKTEKPLENTASNSNMELVNNYNPSEAQALMEKHCYLCHNPTAGENEGRVG